MRLARLSDRSRHRAFVCMLLLLCCPVAYPLDLKQKTIDEWNAYVLASQARMNQRANGKAPFLWLDSVPDGGRRAQDGEVLIAPFDEHTPTRVSDGLIHHWVGASFVRGATIKDMLGVVRDYPHYKDYYHPVVIDSVSDSARSSSSKIGTEDKFHVRLRNKSIIAKTALDASYTASYIQLDARRFYVVAYTTQVQEIDHFEDSAQRELPPDQGSGYIWRLYSITRFAERDGGVYVEVEAIALSRDIPLAVRWVVDPIVRRVSRDALSTSLSQTGQAVRAAMREEAKVGEPARERQPSQGALFLPHR